MSNETAPATADDFRELFDRLSRDEAFNEDGERLTVELDPAATDAQIAEIETPIPQELTALLKVTSGAYVWGIELVGTESATFYERIADRPWTAFTQGDGSGNFDWVVGAGDPEYPNGAVVFYDHSIQQHAMIATNIHEWLITATDQIRSSGSLVRTADFRFGAPVKGLYAPVWKKHLDATGDGR